MFRILIAAVLSLCLGSCGGQHVTFFHPNLVPDAPDEARIFVDARGDLYPRTGIGANYTLPDAADGSLFEAARGADPELCTNASAETEMALLCTALAPACTGGETEMCFARWTEVQETLWEQRGESLSGRFAADGQVTLGVLIHGFNNLYRESQANYAIAQMQMRRAEKTRSSLKFIEVYWDGCRGNDKGIGCWGKAQSTGPLAGFALRRLINSVQDSWPTDTRDPKWRILTHSSGAFVAGATFGDPIAALPQLKDPSTNRWYQVFDQHRRQTEGINRVPRLSDVRLGMFAAATPFVTFGSSEDDGGGVLTRGLDIFLSVQPDDSALTKLILGCQRVGNSCLGARAEQFCLLRRELADLNRDVSVYGYDFYFFFKEICNK